MNNLISEKKLTATVVDILWERIYLFLDVEIEWASDVNQNMELEFFAVNNGMKAKVYFKYEKLGQDLYRLKTNVTNNGENRCIPVGTYRILVCQGEDILADCEMGVNIVANVDSYSRNFLYGKRSKVYTTTFFVEEDQDTLPFRMYCLTAARNKMGFPKNPKLHYIKEFKKKFFNKRSFLRNTYRFFAKLHQVVKKNSKTVLFMTEQSDRIASNLKAVSERMVERGLDQEYRILYSARPAAAGSEGIKSWIRLMVKMAKSDMVILDDHAPVLDWLRLRPEVKVVQLWHAGAGFKSSGYSRWGHLWCPSPVSCHRQYSFGIAGSRQIACFFSEVWGINEEQVLPTGMPRMDEYMDESYRAKKTEELYQTYPVAKGKKVILFAPTYRGKNHIDAHYPYQLIDFERLYEVCGEEYIVFFKMHPWVNAPVPIPEPFKDKFYDVGTYPNINDLFYITDLLITDYSSNIFEYSLRKKPMLFFAFDKVQYGFSRGFHRAYEESAPGKVCYTFAELLTAIEQNDFEAEKVEKYVAEHFDYIDSGASDRVIDWIICGKLPERVKKELQENERRNERMNELDFSILKEEAMNQDAEAEGDNAETENSETEE